MVFGSFSPLIFLHQEINVIYDVTHPPSPRHSEFLIGSILPLSPNFLQPGCPALVSSIKWPFPCIPTFWAKLRFPLHPSFLRQADALYFLNNLSTSPQALYRPLSLYLYASKSLKASLLYQPMSSLPSDR